MFVILQNFSIRNYIYVILTLSNNYISDNYINDLPDGLENVFKMYADDSIVIENGNERVVPDVTEAKKDLGVIITDNCKNKL